MITKEELQNIKFGERVAEEETSFLNDYFLQTEDWRRVYDEEVDIIYGAKGSGKSAIYTTLDNYKGDLFEKKILLTPAENPRGNTVFEGLKTDPPTSEVEFIYLWKLYFALITFLEFKNWGIKHADLVKVEVAFSSSNLIPASFNLKAVLKGCMGYVKKFINVDSVQPGVSLNETTGNISGYNLKISFKEPSSEELKYGIMSIDHIYDLLESTLISNDMILWIAIDRLDVAFADNQELEKNALKALFRVYLDFFKLRKIKLKIFLRDDIWKRITDEGFRESSHITRTLTIEWSKETILNLIILRLLNNDGFVKKNKLDKKEILSDFTKQEELFYRFFPIQIEVGDKKPKTLDWLLGRVKDGKGNVVPREIIHLFNEAKQEQLKKIQIGQKDLESENIISRNSFNQALDTVSKVRLEQTIYAEYPSLKSYIQKLDSEKTEQNLDSLKKIWSTNTDLTKEIARKLVDIGFFKEKGNSDNLSYWVPFLYRNGLKMIQGAAK